MLADGAWGFIVDANQASINWTASSGPRFCISNKIPSNDDVDGPWAILFFYLYLIIYLDLCVCTCSQVPRCPCGGQRTADGVDSLFSTMCVPEIILHGSKVILPTGPPHRLWTTLQVALSLDKDYVSCLKVPKLQHTYVKKRYFWWVFVSPNSTVLFLMLPNLIVLPLLDR